MADDRGFLESIIVAAQKDGNNEVDLCFCVPPSMVRKKREAVDQSRTRYTEVKYCSLTETLESWNYQVWDGVDEHLRKSYPTRPEQIRLVQYDSCRGLEGWSVLNFALDELYDYKKDSYQAEQGGLDDMFTSEGEAAEKYARRWLAIPLTRAIDTLVINIRDPDHFLTDVFLHAAKSSSSVEIINKHGSQ